MDMRMPVMDGFETARRLREMTPYKQIPIIALTADTAPQAEQHCLDAGCTVYVPKPIRAHQLFGLLARYLRDSKDVLKDVLNE